MKHTQNFIVFFSFFYFSEFNFLRSVVRLTLIQTNLHSNKLAPKTSSHKRKVINLFYGSQPAWLKLNVFLELVFAKTNRKKSLHKNKSDSKEIIKTENRFATVKNRNHRPKLTVDITDTTVIAICLSNWKTKKKVQK